MTRTHRQVGRSAQRRGVDYERRIAAAANRVLGATGWQFQRTPRSGGWVAMSKDREYARLRADITAPPDFPFFLECKNRNARWSLDQLVSGGLRSWPPFKWWTDAQSKATPSNKRPLLVFGRNRMPDLVMVLRADFVAEVGPCALTDRVVYAGEMMVLPLDEFLSALASARKERVRGAA